MQRTPVFKFDGCEGFLELGVLFLGDPYNTDYSILGSILGYLNFFGKLPWTLGLAKEDSGGQTLAAGLYVYAFLWQRLLPEGALLHRFRS